jgi:hypothetical protein
MIIVDDFYCCFEIGNFSKFKLERYGEGKLIHPSIKYNVSIAYLLIAEYNRMPIPQVTPYNDSGISHINFCNS